MSSRLARGSTRPPRPGRPGLGRACLRRRAGGCSRRRQFRAPGGGRGGQFRSGRRPGLGAGLVLVVATPTWIASVGRDCGFRWLAAAFAHGASCTGVASAAMACTAGSNAAASRPDGGIERASLLLGLDGRRRAPAPGIGRPGDAGQGYFGPCRPRAPPQPDAKLRLALLALTPASPYSSTSRSGRNAWSDAGPRGPQTLVLVMFMGRPGRRVLGAAARCACAACSAPTRRWKRRSACRRAVPPGVRRLHRVQPGPRLAGAAAAGAGRRLAVGWHAGAADRAADGADGATFPLIAGEIACAFLGAARPARGGIVISPTASVPPALVATFVLLLAMGMRGDCSRRRC